MAAETLRADARSNRDQIVAAALILFRDKGIEVSMKEVADHAGVGVGTLYRRFPDRDALISAAAHAYLTDLADRCAAAAREERDAWSALGRFLRECALADVGAFASSVEPALHTRIQADPVSTQVRATVTDSIARLVTRAHDDGTLRSDVDAADIARLMTVQIYTRPTEDRTVAVGRVVDLLLDGIRSATHP
ncbi:helix-turn-helix domain-containing protein [Nocardia sp. NPDC004168]|uniref:TetR/AcrR family transcriptional regulator n=1 Tax=Nocardia sp. NPDC004168 TaxID=3154452 RepID=UPI0033BB10B0